MMTRFFKFFGKRNATQQQHDDLPRRKFDPNKPWNHLIHAENSLDFRLQEKLTPDEYKNFLRFTNLTYRYAIMFWLKKHIYIGDIPEEFFKANWGPAFDAELVKRVRASGLIPTGEDAPAPPGAEL